MAVRRLRLPPRQLLLLLVVFTLGLASALVWLGWRLVRQDRDLESQRVREHLERAATTVATELERGVAGITGALEQAAALPAAARAAALTGWGDSLAPGALLVAIGAEEVRAYPSDRLLFAPSAATAPLVPDQVFQPAEQLEFQRRDFAGAEAAYRALLTRSGDSLIRAGALLRLGRTQRKAGKLASALESYARLAGYQGVALDGRPAELAARHASVELLTQLGRTAEARTAAATLNRELFAGRWAGGGLSRGTFEFYAGELRGLLGAAADSVAGQPAVVEALALAAAVDSLWRESGRGSPPDGSGNRLVPAGEATVLSTWAARSGTRLALLATPGYLERAWLLELAPLLAREGVWLTLTTPAGRAVYAQASNGAAPGIVRSAGESGLPWTLSLTSRDPSALAGDLAARRRILLAGLLVASLLALIGTYAVARAVYRELEVARVQSDFVAAVSHEFRTPLTSIRQLSELLASDRVPTEERRHAYYTLLRQESLRLHRLVEGLLDFGRMEVGAREFRLEPLEAGELVRGVVHEFQAEPAGREHPIELVDSPASCPVRADREALGRALWNLLDNAAKYSAQEQPVTVRLTRDNGRVEISVADRGPGIAAEEQAQVFEKFIRGREARASGVRGTGLGLAMVRQIARAHGGEITLHSSPGQGSTFTLSLPAEEPA